MGLCSTRCGSGNGHSPAAWPIADAPGVTAGSCCTAVYTLA
jgi:hypothetical protein